MPRGFSGVKKASAESQARREAAQRPRALYFQLPEDGDTAIVRFLEQDDNIAWAYVHEVPVEGRSYGDKIPCLDQDDEDEPCPGCEANLPRKFQGWINLIWFDGPIYKKDEKNRVVKENGKKVIVSRKTQVAVWSSGQRLFDDLDELNESWKGLRSRRFKVKRKGTGLDTRYAITPEDVDSGPQEFSSEESRLEQESYDLNEFMKPPEYGQLEKRIKGGGVHVSSSSNGDGDSEERKPPKNPFLRNK